MSNAPLAIDFASHTNTGARALLAANNLGKAVCTAIDKTMTFYGMHRGLRAAFGLSPATSFTVKQNATGIATSISIPRMGSYTSRSFSIGIDYGQGCPSDMDIGLKFEKAFDEHGFHSRVAVDEIVKKINFYLNLYPALTIKANHIHGAAVSDMLAELIRNPNQNPADFFKAKPADPAAGLHAQ